MTDLATIRAAIADALGPVGTDVQVSPYVLATPTPPTLQVLPRSMNYDRAMHRGVDVREYIVQGFVPYNEGDESQRLLDELLSPTGPRSVKTLLEADKTLGGVVSAVNVTSDSGLAMQLHPSGAWVLLAEWTVEVWTQN
jgi:hypothetical protein